MTARLTTIILAIAAASLTTAQAIPTQSQDQPPSAKAPAPMPPQPTGIAATVDGVQISVADVADRAFQERSRHTTQELIDNILVDHAAKKAGIVVTDADVAEATSQIAKKIAPQTMEEGLKEHDLTPAVFEDVRRHEIELDRLALIGVDPVKMVHVRQICINYGQTRPESAAAALVAKIQTQLKSGTTFEDVAKQYDESPASQPNAGDAGIVYPGSQLGPVYNTAALALTTPGQITPEPIKTDIGYCLIQLISSTDKHPATEDPLYDAAVKQWQQQQANMRVYHVLMDLRAKAKIQNWYPETPTSP